MRTIEVEVRIESGLHARPAAAFVRAASGFDSAVRLENVTLGGQSADAKSIIGVLTTGTERGHLVRVTADGSDEQDVIAVLSDLLAGLGEPVSDRAGG